MLKRNQPSKSWRRVGVTLVVVLALGTGFTASAMRPSTLSTAQAPIVPASAGMTMRLVDELHSQRAKVGRMLLEPELVVSSNMVADAHTAVDQQHQRIVRFRLTSEGASRLAAATHDNVGRRLAILVNGKVVFAPVIRAQITGGVGEISGNFTPTEADTLVAAILQGRSS